MNLEEEQTLGQKINKFFAFTFITLLAVMLSITFIQGDSEKYLLSMLTGQDQTIAGKIGGEPIQNDYFKAARLECYYLFKERFPSMADDPSTLNNCAFNQIKNHKIDKVFANALGYRVSEIGIKQEISDEARRIHSQATVSAGYSKEEMRSVDDIYKVILNQVPMNYRQDSEISRRILDGFLFTDIKESQAEKDIKQEMESLKLSISYISFSDEDLVKITGSEFPVSEEEIKKDYDDSVTNKTIPLATDGKPETLENRKAFILNKLRSEKKEKQISALKAKILSTKGEANSNLSTIATMSNSTIQDLNSISFAKLDDKENKSLPKFLTSSSFLKDATKTSFGKGRIGGPYTEKDKTIYVEFKDMKFETVASSPAKNSEFNQQNKIRMFLYEIKQSLTGNYPIERNIADKNQVE